MTKRPFSLLALQITLFLCGGLALGYSGFVLVRAHLYQKAALRQFETTAPPANVPSARSIPILRPVADGAPLLRFEIPRLHLNTVVIEGDSEADLKLGPGHIPGTALPGAIGNVGIAGHRDTVFRPLRNIRPGDLITLTSGGNSYHYEVDSTEIVAPERSDVLNPTRDRHLTLVTCFPFYYVGSAPKRFIVRAREIDWDQAASAGQ